MSQSRIVTPAAAILAFALPLAGALDAPANAVAQEHPQRPVAVAAPAALVPPKFTWGDRAKLNEADLGGLAANVTFVPTNDGTRGLLVKVNTGLATGYEVKAFSWTGSDWGNPETLGKALAAGFDGVRDEPSFFVAASPEGPIALWRSGAQEVTLATLSTSSWATTTFQVDEEVLNGTRGARWIALGRTEAVTFVYILGSNSGSTVSRIWRWTQIDSPPTVADLPNFTLSDGHYINNRVQPWFESDGTLRVAFAEGVAASPTSNVGNIVEQTLPVGGNTWTAPTFIASQVQQASILKAITVDGVPGLLWNSLDAKYGQTTQTHGAWLDDESWSKPFLAGDGWLRGTPASTQTGPSCVATDQGMWVLEPNEAPTPLKASTPGGTPLWSVPTVYQAQAQGCVQPFPSGTYATPTNSGMVEWLSGDYVAVAPDTSMQIASIDNGAVSTAALQVVAPTAPGPVQDLKMKAKQGRKTLTMRITWSAPKAPVNPDPNYKIRVKVGSQDSGWMNAQARTSWMVRGIQPKVKVVVQVKAVNTVAESPIRTVRYRPGR